jgi:predicted fused transcriptional regulator/phosphomethylpyrimidine kinase
MTVSRFSRLLFLLILLFSASIAFGQENAEKIKARWSLDKFDPEGNSPGALKAKEELQDVFLTFSKDQLIISRKTENGDVVIKKGEYAVSGNSVILGKDKAEIILLSEKQLTIKIPGQGLMYLTRID